MKTLPNFSEFRSQNVQTFGYAFHDTYGQNHGQTFRTQWFLLNETCADTPLAGLLRGRKFDKNLLELGWEKVPNWEWLFVHRKQGLFLSVHVDDIKMAGKKQIMARMWKKVMKNVVLDEPTSLLDHVYLECPQRECKTNDEIMENYKKLFESRVSAGATAKVPG